MSWVCFLVCMYFFVPPPYDILNIPEVRIILVARLPYFFPLLWSHFPTYVLSALITLFLQLLSGPNILPPFFPLHQKRLPGSWFWRIVRSASVLGAPFVLSLLWGITLCCRRFRCSDVWRRLLLLRLRSLVKRLLESENVGWVCKEGGWGVKTICREGAKVMRRRNNL